MSICYNQQYSRYGDVEVMKQPISIDANDDTDDTDRKVSSNAIAIRNNINPESMESDCFDFYTANLVSMELSNYFVDFGMFVEEQNTCLL